MSKYGPIIGSGAEKLAESAVAPLVAVAHGFRSITPDTTKELLAELGYASNSIPARQIRAAVGDREAMVMQWYTPESCIEQASADYPVKPSSIQLRPHPANVATESNGKKKKYLNIAGMDTVLGVHPATPPGWLKQPIGHMLIAEGAMKADSAMSAYLRAHGASEDDLQVSSDEGQLAAIARMRKLLEGIDPTERVVIMSVVGVGNWHKNPEWNTVRIDGGEVWLSFDGDVGSNSNVWSQANQMFNFLRSRKAEPFLVDLSKERTAEGDKVGVDDWLAMGHTWDELVSERITPNLPPRPEGAVEGKFRMNDKTCQMEERVVSKTADGDVQTDWVPKVDLIARVAQIDERREVTPEEEESGVYDANVSPREVISEVAIEVRWNDEGAEHSSLVEGPSTLMATKPERWTDKALNTGIAAEVLALPAWPPAHPGFLEAMKSFRRADIERKSAWTHMGWVPRRDKLSPVFVVGRQVVGSEGWMPDAAALGVRESEMSGAEDFGVDLPESDEQLRNDIRTVLSAYTACWSDIASAGVVIASGLRPAIPRTPSLTVFYSGGSNSGKALDLNTMVPTPTGRKRVGDLRVGDDIIAPDGQPTRVRGLSPIWNDEDMYELETGDGQVLRMSGNHVLRVSDSLSRRRERARASSERMAKAATLRKLALAMRGGDAASLTHIAEMLEPVAGLGRQTVANVVAKAGIPSDVHRLVAGGHSGEFVEVDGFVLQRTAVSSQTGVGGKLTRLYPVPEVLLALAEHLESGLNHVDTPVVYSAKVSQVAEDFGEKGYAIPMFEGLDLPERDLPVGPYTLGAWLGDGTGVNGSITTMDAEVLAQVAAEGYETVLRPSSEREGVRSTVHNVVGLSTQLRACGLKGNKYIPMEYLRSSRGQRLALLRGLMDTDGTISPDGHCELSLSDPTLAADALDLIRSLGIKASMTTGPAGYRNAAGEQVECKDRHRIHFTTSLPVFGMARKAQWLPVELRSSSQWLPIREVRRVETVPSRCVQVEHPTGCFVSDGYVVSHNSFSSEATMAYWQPRPGVWDRHLPGSANDTLASTEIALSKAPIWVSDDNAPSASNPRAQAERTEVINQTIRNVHNGTSRRRATKDMGSAATFTPRALFIVSAESAPIDDQSIMNRLVHVEVAPGFLVPSREPTDALQRLNRTTTTTSRVTGGVLQMLARHIAKRGWREVRQEWQQLFEDISEDTHEVIRSSYPTAMVNAKRQSETVADLLLGIEALRMLCSELGMYGEVSDTIEAMFTGLQTLAIEGFAETRSSDLGNRVLSDITMLLRSGQAHIAALGVPGPPVVSGTSECESKAMADARNQALGWKLTGDDNHPYDARGEQVGYLVYKNDKPVVVLTDAAFQQVQRKATTRAGINAKSAFEAMWRSELTVPEDEGWKRKPRAGRKKDYKVRVTVNGVSAEGVPVYLSRIVD